MLDGQLHARLAVRSAEVDVNLAVLARWKRLHDVLHHSAAVSLRGAAEVDGILRGEREARCHVRVADGKRVLLPDSCSSDARASRARAVRGAIDDGAERVDWARVERAVRGCVGARARVDWHPLGAICRREPQAVTITSVGCHEVARV